MSNEPGWCATHQQNGILVSGIGRCFLCYQNAAVASQSLPIYGRTEVLPLVIADLEARAVMGQRKYGMPLMVENGRDHLVDAYQEALDLCMYLRAALEERRQEAITKRTKDGHTGNK